MPYLTGLLITSLPFLLDRWLFLSPASRCACSLDVPVRTTHNTLRWDGLRGSKHG